MMNKLSRYIKIAAAAVLLAAGSGGAACRGNDFMP